MDRLRTLLKVSGIEDVIAEQVGRGRGQVAGMTGHLDLDGVSEAGLTLKAEYPCHAKPASFRFNHRELLPFRSCSALAKARDAGKAINLVGHDRRLARADALEQIAVGNIGDALPPRTIARREVRFYVVVRAEIGTYAGQQFLYVGGGKGI